MVAAIVAAFGQVTLGGVVRVTDSGLGCPDWPLCHGQLIPPFEVATLIEYSHRLSASVLGVLVLGTAVIAWLRHSHRRWVLVPSVLSLGLVIVAAVLGGVTVLTELAWWFVLLHLGIAQALVASLIVAAVAGWPTDDDALVVEGYDSPTVSRLETLAVASVVGVFVVILSGSFMVGYGAGSSCATWPLCRGSLVPEGAPYAIHMGHRLVVVAVGLLLAVTAIKAWTHRSAIPNVARWGVVMFFAFAVQVALGAVTVWAGFTPEVKALHLSVATLVWVALIATTSLIYLPRLYSTAPNPRGA